MQEIPLKAFRQFVQKCNEGEKLSKNMMKKPQTWENHEEKREREIVNREVAELLQRKESMIDIESPLPELLNANHHAAEKEVQLAINLTTITPPLHHSSTVPLCKRRRRRRRIRNDFNGSE
ncbi:hypothetical protein QL285_044070 [Trifolium repens]|nr:hypothetical protein QL285_044070 [Trifolium repens]